MKNLTKNKFGFFLLILNILLLALSISYFSYSLMLLKRIETLLRIGIIVFLILLAIFFIMLIIKNLFRKKYFKLVIVTFFIIIISFGISFIGYNINKVYSVISKISTNSQTFSSSIVVRADSNFSAISDISSEKIGILSDSESVDGYKIPKEIISDNKLSNELIEFDNYLDLINALLDKKVNVIFLPTNYSILFATVEGFEDLNQTTKIIYTKDKNVKVETTLGTKNLTEPFTILLMGVDSEKEEIKGSSFNGDSLVLITFNPKTLNTTILSIPRDTYTPIACFAGQKKNKITHAAWYGESCMMKTIQNMFDINIDYYVKINFKGVVNIVDALGGVDVDVPFSFCEQNSNREFGDKTIYVRQGFQTLNGEQALALSRNRHPWHEYCSKEWTNYSSNDFVRGQNQQLIIQALLDKMKSINSVDTFYDLLNSISMSMETNMTTENILSFYNIGKDVLLKGSNKSTELSNLVGFQRLYLSGYDQRIVDYDANSNTGSKLSLYNFIPYQGSIKDISKAMKINLEIIKDEPIKTFSFDINEPYEETIIGKGKYSDAGVSLLPSFVGKKLSEVQSYCSQRGIPLTVNKVKTISSSYDGMVSTQSLPAGMDASYVSKSKGLTVSVYEYEKAGGNSTTSGNVTQVVPGLPTQDEKKSDKSNTQSDNQNSNQQKTNSSNDKSTNQNNTSASTDKPVDDDKKTTEVKPAETKPATEEKKTTDTSTNTTDITSGNDETE